ncbi:MAG TPA: sigma-70 family RNA polymerase sigma factor [Sunxiuqinia sp.]|nr:sigma-70 family RNA polymerase sigma factor [Sunxiuqinia sp.]
MTKHEFKQLFDRHFDAIRNYIYYRSGDAELSTDIAQDVFLRLWEKQTEYRERENVGLLYKMAADEFISRYRRQQVELGYLKSLSFKLHDVPPDEELQYKELQQKYEAALADLSDKQRVVFLMSRSDGLKYHEIAERLGVSVKAVEKRMKYALDFLKLKLDVR